MEQIGVHRPQQLYPNSQPNHISWWLPLLQPILNKDIFLSFAFFAPAPSLMAAADLINIISVRIEASFFGSSGAYLLPPLCLSPSMHMHKQLPEGRHITKSNHVWICLVIYFISCFILIVSSLVLSLSLLPHLFPTWGNFPYMSHLCLVVSPPCCVYQPRFPAPCCHFVWSSWWTVVRWFMSEWFLVLRPSFLVSWVLRFCLSVLYLCCEFWLSGFWPWTK